MEWMQDRKTQRDLARLNARSAARKAIRTERCDTTPILRGRATERNGDIVKAVRFSLSKPPIAPRKRGASPRQDINPLALLEYSDDSFLNLSSEELSQQEQLLKSFEMQKKAGRDKNV